MTAERCKHGSTEGTCKRGCLHAAYASYTFDGPGGQPMSSHIRRPRNLSDEEWEQRQLDVLERIGETLHQIHDKIELERLQRKLRAAKKVRAGNGEA